MTEEQKQKDDGKLAEGRTTEDAYLGVTMVTSLLGCEKQQVVMVKVGGVWGRLLTE